MSIYLTLVNLILTNTKVLSIAITIGKFPVAIAFSNVYHFELAIINKLYHLLITISLAFIIHYPNQKCKIFYNHVEIKQSKHYLKAMKNYYKKNAW